MSVNYINTRSKKILYMIISADDYVSLDEIAKEVKLSKRSIYYEICKVNEWLEGCQLPELEIIRGRGIRLEADKKEKIEQIMENGKTKESYVFSPTERMQVIICYIIYAKEPIYIEELTEYCMVSRNTIFNDLRAVVSQLQEYNLKLEYETRKGYQIAGDNIRIRALFFLYFSLLRPLFETGILKFINQEEMEQCYEKLKKIEAELNTSYVDGVLLSIATLLPIMLRNDQQMYFPGLKKEEMCTSREYQLIEKYFPELCEIEKIYLCLHLLGSRVSVASADIFDSPANQTVYEISKALVSEFEKVACVIFEEREELERALFVHINASLYRYQYGIQIGNAMKQDIVREYSDLFELTRIVCKYLEQQIGLPIPDGEIAYLALHFGAHLQGGQTQNEELRILIVCVNGISTGNMIRREVSQLLPDAKIVDVAAASGIRNIHNICDIVISTVRIKSLVPVIVVNPILTDLDRKNILNNSIVKSKIGLVDTEAVFEIMKKYVKETDQEKVKRDLIEYFGERAGDTSVIRGKNYPGLCDILNTEKVQILDADLKWGQSLRLAGQCLIKKGSITPEYIESIISQIRYYGPYMFLMPGVILAHAKPENGVNHMDVSFCILKREVKYSEFHKARIIIVLAAENQEKHLKILKDIMKVLEDTARVEDLTRLNRPEEVVEYLSKVLKK
ncbi:MAG: BglG family transcription antiterminator [Lachnospiraceae bacterium]|nr:BglG family transcription antiterminator [Lachnospiraceae bacterium]